MGINLQPLLGYQALTDVVIYQYDRAITVQQLISDIAYLDQYLPKHQHLLNLYENRYHFLLGLLLGIKRQSVHLFPSNTTEYTLDFLEKKYPDILMLNQDNLACGKMNFLDIKILLQEKPVHFLAQSFLSFKEDSFTKDNIVIFTSGSTGKPKPFVKKWQDFIVVAEQLATKLATKEHAMILATVPAQHTYGLETSIIMPLVNGFSIYDERPFYPADIEKILMKQARATILISTPIHIRACLNTQVRLPFLQYSVSATAPLESDHARQFEQNYNAPLHEIYGCTEVGVIALRQPTQSPLWQCLDDIKIEITQPINTEEHDYCLRTTRSIQTFILNDYITDLNDNCFLLNGRKSDVINLAGKRTSLAYLNHHLLNIEAIKDGCFYQPELKDDKHQRLVVFIVLEKNFFTLKALKKALQKKVDTIFLPRQCYIIKQLPRNKTGKILNNEIKLLYSEKNASKNI
ncbi:MAG: acyl-CoA synthetase [Gammaproteobacteria bacterium]|nr:acyl-CoA synthetase [Gammaproteobacteria bacterium]